MEEGGTTRGRRFSPRETTTTTSRSESFSQPGHDHRSRTNRVAPTPHISINDIRLDSIRSPPLFAFQKTFTAPVSADFLPNRAPLYPSLTASSAFLSIFFFFFSFLSFFLSRINSIRSISSLRRTCISVNGGDRESLDGSFINRAARNYFRLITRASWRSRTDRATRACSVEPRKLGGIS